MRVHGLSVLATLALAALSSASIEAQTPESFEEAQLLSTQSHRLILLEFYRDG